MRTMGVPECGARRKRWVSPITDYCLPIAAVDRDDRMIAPQQRGVETGLHCLPSVDTAS